MLLEAALLRIVIFYCAQCVISGFSEGLCFGQNAFILTLKVYSPISMISGLWPFSTLGWPDTSSEDLMKFYPTSVLETGYALFKSLYMKCLNFKIDESNSMPN